MSSHFQFSLQRVLELRERLEEQAAQELGHLQSLEIDARRTLALQDSQRGQQLSAWREISQGVLDIGELETYQRYLELLDQEIDQQRALVQELAASVRQQTEKYLAARRKREMLEKLKEKEYAEYHRELLGKEQRELDDIAATRFMQREAPSS